MATSSTATLPYIIVIAEDMDAFTTIMASMQTVAPHGTADYEITRQQEADTKEVDMVQQLEKEEELFMEMDSTLMLQEEEKGTTEETLLKTAAQEIPEMIIQEETAT